MSQQQEAALADNLPLSELVDESFEEARFLWRRWEAELTSLTRNLYEVWSWTEDRLQGSLEGVRVSPKRLVELCTPGLTGADLHDLKVSAALLASCGGDEARSLLSDALREADAIRAQALLRGLVVAGSHECVAHVVSTLSVSKPIDAAALCRIKAFWGAPPDREIVCAFESEVPDFQIAALRAARYAPEQHLEHWVKAGLSSAAPKVQQAAIQTGILRGSRAALHAAVDFASELSPSSAPYLSSVALFGTIEQHEIIYSALSIPALQPDAIWALGQIGTTRAIEICLHGMKHEKLARRAGETYCHITGADLERDKLAHPEMRNDAPAFEDDDLDADLVPTPEMLWPHPDPEAVNADWSARARDMQPGTRYVRGQALNMDVLIAAIESGPMLRRADLALELSARTRGRYDVQTTAFAARQWQMMSRGRSVLSGDHS